MHFLQSLAIFTLVCSASIQALPQSFNEILRRDSVADTCQVCTDCKPFDDNDTCILKLPQVGGSNGIAMYGNDSHIQVQFETSGFSEGDVYVNKMTISAQEQSGEEYNVEVTFNKYEKNSDFKVVKTTKVPFFYTIKGPSLCSMETPGGFTLSDVASIKATLV